MKQDDLYSITQQYNVKKGKDIFVLRIIPSIDSDGFAKLRGLAKNIGGYYSTFVHGFVFDNVESAGFFGGDVYQYFEELNGVPEYEEEYQTIAASKKYKEKKNISFSETTKSETEPSAYPVEPRLRHLSYDMAGIGFLKLHEAIKRIVDCDGIEALKNVTIVNLLSDFQAYKDIPAAKFVLRMFISEGYVQKLLAVGTWNNQCQMLANKFVAETGFQNNIADFVIQSVACALGWKKDVDLTSSTVSHGNQPTQQSAPSSPSSHSSSSPTKPAPRASAEKWEDYLESLVEWKVDLLKKYKVKTHLSITLEEGNYFTIYCDLEGKTKDAIALHAAIYDEKGKMRAHPQFLYTWTPLNGFYSDDCYVDEIKANKVGKIIIREGT